MPPNCNTQERLINAEAFITREIHLSEAAAARTRPGLSPARPRDLTSRRAGRRGEQRRSWAERSRGCVRDAARLPGKDQMRA